MDSPERFFSAAILAGRLHVLGVPQWGPWDAARVELRAEDEITCSMNETAGDRKIRTPEELEAIMRAPTGATPTRRIWIHESLVAEARRLWEQMTAALRDP